MHLGLLYNSHLCVDISVSILQLLWLSYCQRFTFTFTDVSKLRHINNVSGENICGCKSCSGSISSTPMFTRSYRVNPTKVCQILVSSSCKLDMNLYRIWSFFNHRRKMDLLLYQKELQLVEWCSAEQFHGNFQSILKIIAFINVSWFMLLIID